MNTKLY